MTDESNSEKEIHDNEDCKTKVEPSDDACAACGCETSCESSCCSAETSDSDWPEPTLALLVTTVATQAMMGLGVVPKPGSDKPEVDLTQAKHLVDTVQMLFDKTDGNRTEEETTLITSMLHNLRMTYVAVQQGSSEPKTE